MKTQKKKIVINPETLDLAIKAISKCLLDQLDEHWKVKPEDADIHARLQRAFIELMNAKVGK